jgi:hypothetical protein
MEVGVLGLVETGVPGRPSKPEQSVRLKYIRQHRECYGCSLHAYGSITMLLLLLLQAAC